MKNGIYKLREVIPTHMVQHILTIEIGRHNINDNLVWDLTENGKYTNKSTWNMIRSCKVKEQQLSKVWQSSIPFNVSFLIWRLWKFKLPFDDVLTRFGRNITTMCKCCDI